MDETLRVGDRVKVYLDSNFWKSDGWFEGTLRRIDPYSEHRSFYWVELDSADPACPGQLNQAGLGAKPKKYPESKLNRRTCGTCFLP